MTVSAIRRIGLREKCITVWGGKGLGWGGGREGGGGGGGKGKKGGVGSWRREEVRG